MSGERSARIVQQIVARVRAQGFFWIWRRLSYEFDHPSTQVGSAVRLRLARLLGRSKERRRASASPDPATRRTLFAFYDLKVSPVTFDVLWFIVGADATRDGLGLDAIHFVIVPGPHDGLREEEPQYERVIDTEARRWRIVYLLCPCFGLLSTKVNWTVAASRAHAASIRDKAAHVYPAGYEVLLPSTAAQRAALDLARRGHRIGRLRAPPESRRQVSLWLDRHSAGRRCVTITLRNYSYMTDRNSDQAEWVAFAKSLDTAVYFPVFVLDLEQTLSDTPPALTNFTIFREASWNIGLRLALYEASFLNLGINNGPMNLCILSDLVRSLTFKIVTPSVPQASEDFIRAHGFEIGHSPFFLTPAQKWIWENDRADVISREFNAMVSYLECPSRREGVL